MMDEDEYFRTMRESNKLARVASKEEIRQREEELAQAKITPELLRFFDRNEVRRLVEYFYRTPGQATSDAGYRYDLSRLSREANDFLAKEVKGRRVIELGNKGCGPGLNVPSTTLLNLGAIDYSGCDPVRNIDGLTFLLRQPDESAVVTSFGVLDEGVLFAGECGIGALLNRYVDELGKQIYRVTPRNGITFHGTDSGVGYLIRAGFEEDASAPTIGQQNVNGKIVVLRKR